MSSSSANRGTGRLTDSPNRLLGAVFGVVYLLVGLLGFAYTGLQRLRRHQHRRQDPRHLRGQPAAQHRAPADRRPAAVRCAEGRRRGKGQQHPGRRGLPAARHRRSVHPRQRRQHPVAEQRRQRAAPRQRRAAARRRPLAGQERPPRRTGRLTSDHAHERLSAARTWPGAGRGSPRSAPGSCTSPSSASTWPSGCWPALFFAVLGAAQIGWGLAALARDRAPFPRAVIGVNVGVLALWVVSRTVGLPVGPEAGTAEAVGRADVLCMALQLLVVGSLAGLAAYVGCERSGQRARYASARGWRAGRRCAGRCRRSPHRRSPRPSPASTPTRTAATASRTSTTSRADSTTTVSITRTSPGKIPKVA